MSKAKSKSAANNLNKELQKKVDELTQQLENLKNEHDELKNKYKILCKKVVDNTDLSEYSFMDPSQIEPENIDLSDLLHMVQKLALLASQINAEENMGSHIESLELRITELTNENSSFFKNRLKVQERLEFIRQERDVWKRNAETLKKMYTQLAKEKESNSHFKSNSVANRCTIGTYRANIDSKNPSERVFSAPVPKEFYDTVRTSNIPAVHLEKIDQNISSQLAAIKQSTPTIDDSKNFFGANFKLDENNLKNCSPIPNQNLSESYMNFSYIDKAKLVNDLNMNDQYVPNSAYSIESAFNDPSTTTSTNHNIKKNVSFNKDIDVRIFRKNSKNLTKIVDSFLLPLPQGNADSNQINNCQKDAQIVHENITTIKKNSDDLSQIEHKNRNHFNQLNQKSDSNSLFSFVQKQSASQGSNFFSNNSRTIQSGRGSVCSSRKLPGETPVRDLEPTLKLIIIKELSIEKIDGNDWRMFAIRVGLNENEIKEWISLKLQYPMARVLSFWSSKPEATIRLLHRHLNAPCFNYGSLAKRIENFYDVI